jgi:hypothetical protein
VDADEGDQGDPMIWDFRSTGRRTRDNGFGLNNSIGYNELQGCECAGLE